MRVRHPLRSPLAVALSLALFPVAAASAQSPVRTDPARLDRVVVTADPFGDRTVDDIVQPVTVVSGESLDDRRAGTIGEVLDGLPGVANASFGPGVGRPVVRGQQGSRVVVLEDGLGTGDVSGEGADHAIGIDAERARQIEVFRGPATLLYGSGAAGGVVNVRSGRFSPESGDRTRIDLEGRYSDNGADRTGRVELEQPLGTGFVLRGDYTARRSNDFSIDGFQEEGQTEGFRNRLQNSSVDTDSGSLTGVFRGDRGFVGLGLSRWETEYGIPEVFDPQRVRGDGSDEFERIEAEAERYDLRAELLDPMPGFTALRFKAAYTRFEQEELEYEFSRSTGELEDIEEEAEFLNKEWDARLELVHAPIAGMRGVVGLQLNDRDFFADVPEDEDEYYYIRPNRTRTTALFLLEELPTGFGRLEFGARVERTRTTARDIFNNDVDGVTGPDGDFLPFPEAIDRRSFTPVSLSAGSIIDVGTDLHLRLAATRAQRAPSPEQLYAFGRHAAAGTFEVGNPDLSKETYTNFEVGLDRHVGAFRFDATLFYNRASDYIFLASEDDGTGNPVQVNDIGNRAGEGATVGCAPGDRGLCRLRNQLVFNQQSDASFYGAEFGASLDLGGAARPFVLRGSGDLVRGRLRGDGGNLPRITPSRLGVGFDTRFDAVRLSADYMRVNSQTRLGVAEDETEGFNLVSFDLTWSPEAWGGNTALFLRGRNLLNEDGRLHQSFLKDDAPILGRAFIAGFRVGFGG